MPTYKQGGEALAFVGLIRALYPDYTAFSVAKPHNYLNCPGLDDHKTTL